MTGEFMRGLLNDRVIVASPVYLTSRKIPAPSHRRGPRLASPLALAYNSCPAKETAPRGIIAAKSPDFWPHHAGSASGPSAPGQLRAGLDPKRPHRARDRRARPLGAVARGLRAQRPSRSRHPPEPAAGALLRGGRRGPPPAHDLHPSLCHGGGSATLH